MHGESVAWLIVVCCAALGAAGPAVRVDRAEHDAGVVYEGATEKVRHVFVLTNTGDDTLRIQDVRAG